MSTVTQASGFEVVTFENHAALLIGLHDDRTAAWHRNPPVSNDSLGEFERTLVKQHLTNFQLWHAEDSARAPGVRDDELVRIKRFIDVTNQSRNDLVEKCDRLLLNYLAQRNLPESAAELHSETPGLMIDRLSILSLKLFHTAEEIDRADAPPGHAQLNQQRLLILKEQRDDLAGALDGLWRKILAGQRRFKLYHQLKMYNDPALNPAVYAAHPSS